MVIFGLKFVSSGLVYFIVLTRILGLWWGGGGDWPPKRVNDQKWMKDLPEIGLINHGSSILSSFFFNLRFSCIRYSVADTSFLFQSHPMQQNFVAQHVVDPSQSVQSVLFPQGSMLMQPDPRQQQYFATTTQPSMPMSYPGSECEYSAPVSEVEFPVGAGGGGAHLWNVEQRPAHLSIGVLPQTFPASFLPIAAMSPNPPGGFGYLAAGQPADVQPLSIAGLNLQPRPWSSQALSPAMNGSLISTSETVWSPIYPAHQSHRHFEALDEPRDSNVPPRFRQSSTAAAAEHRISPPMPAVAPGNAADVAVNEATAAAGKQSTAAYELREEDFPAISSSRADSMSKNAGKSVGDPRNGCSRDRAVQTRKYLRLVHSLVRWPKAGRGLEHWRTWAEPPPCRK